MYIVEKNDHTEGSVRSFCYNIGVVEARRVELLSENIFAALSTSLVYGSGFPGGKFHKQIFPFGSFIIPGAGKAYRTHVHRLDDASLFRNGNGRETAAFN